MYTPSLSRVEALFHAVVNLPAAERATVLADRCVDHPEMRAFVERLLANHDSGMGGFLVPEVIVSEDIDAELIFSPGNLVAERYRVVRLVGRGGMGEVYEAIDNELDVPVALKTLRWELASEPEALRRLKQEVLFARSITHRNVCRVYDVGRHEWKSGAPLWFLTMEFLRGETLVERLGRDGAMPVSAALPLVEQVVAGLEAAHRAGVMHLDFKSGNVILVSERSGRERAVVTDFGLARMADARVGSEAGHRVIGTPAYMAPEQVRGEEPGPAADIYALGVVLYEMVTGMLPFTGRTPLEVAELRLSEKPPRPRQVVPDLDERWEEVILRCLSRDPGKRYQSAEEVARVLGWRLRSAETITSAVKLRGARGLPAERDAFIGRERELEDLRQCFGRGKRLVTLLGPGGMGKTRLAVRYGWQNLGDWTGEVWFCDLTESRDLNGILSVVGSTLGVNLGKGDSLDQLGRAIAGRGRCLIMLDNCEQVARDAGAALGSWLERAPEAHFLVTSRERLKVRGEDVQTLEPLDLQMGIDLFMERARQQHPGFEAKGGELVAVREVVQLAEGMPLAIELAAARVRIMTARQMVDRMRERLRVLAGAGEDRHGSLRAAIDASWELLAPWEQSAWAQCAVFEGGFTLEAVEQVVDLGRWADAPWIVDIVQSLVDKSLLRVRTAEDDDKFETHRFGMYASLQEYARAKLEAGGLGESRAAEQRHGRWYARCGTIEAIEALDGEKGVERRQRLAQELENLIAACRRATRHGDGATATTAYRAAFSVLNLRGPLAVAVELGHEVLAAPIAGESRVSALLTLGMAERFSGATDEPRVHMDEALALARELNDRDLECMLLSGLGGLLRDQCKVPDARHHLESALALAEEIENPRLGYVVMNNLGLLYLDIGMMDEARPLLERAVCGGREVGNKVLEANASSNLGILLAQRGFREQARVYYESALAIHRKLNNRRSQINALTNLGNLHAEQGHWDEARPYYEEALAIACEVGDRRGEVLALGNLGNMHRAQGRIEEATACCERAVAIAREVGDKQREGGILCELAALLQHQGKPDAARDAIASGEAIIRQLGARYDLGMLLCARGELELGWGDVAAARAHLAEAESLAAQVGTGSDSQLGRIITAFRGKLAALA